MPALHWLVWVTLLVAIITVISLSVYVLQDGSPHRRSRPSRSRRRVAILAMTTLLVGTTGIPAAQADPFCWAGWCGRVTVHNKSSAKCIVVIDQDWSNGSKGKHYTLDDNSRTARPASSTHYWKDTDAFYVRSTCKSVKRIKDGKYVKTYKAARWYKVPSGTSLNLVVR